MSRAFRVSCPLAALLNRADSLEMLVSGRVAKSSLVCVLQAVSEEQQPGLKSRRGKEEKSRGKAKVSEWLTAGGAAALVGAAAFHQARLSLVSLKISLLLQAVKGKVAKR